jgi:cytidine deaminase
MKSIKVDIPCPYCKRRIRELNDDNAEKVTTTQYVVYCECGEDILYEDNKK